MSDTKKNLAIAQERLETIKPLLDLPERSREDVVRRAAEVGRNAGTLYAWIQRFTAQNDVTALIPQPRGWQKGKHRISIKADAIIQDVIDDNHVSKDHPSIKATITDVKTKCRNANVDCPSESTIRARLTEVSERLQQNNTAHLTKATARLLTATPEARINWVLRNHALQYPERQHAEQLLIEGLYRREGEPAHAILLTGAHSSGKTALLESLVVEHGRPFRRGLRPLRGLPPRPQLGAALRTRPRCWTTANASQRNTSTASSSSDGTIPGNSTNPGP